ncbi:NUDIX domain-containing protein [Salinimicrobium sediminis]|uniref:NUDIX domain-containing protein n=1 Tax=Salinimicrobium sediminis TaxID=1343891 RepID=A0A285X7U9_9FLAO|nr:CoA pyrophosphatase [Salinimicrobium sediminis]SOC81402.1 NUDIX domain-containing protein [Salinimicrobium sediminis]
MNFQNFLNISPKLRKIKLPGEEAHFKLAPMLRLQELENLKIEEKNSKKAAVMAVFYPGQQEETKFVLILRKTYQGVHSNQVGFPGGRVEPEDRDLAHTALRETEEEVGIPQHEVEVIKELTRLYIPPSNFWVHPFMGIMKRTPILIPQEEEVESVLEINLLDFLNDSCLTRETLSTSYAKEIEVPAFVLGGHIVWGATAMMLSEMKDILEQAL